MNLQHLKTATINSLKSPTPWLILSMVVLCSNQINTMYALHDTNVKQHSIDSVQTRRLDKISVVARSVVGQWEYSDLLDSIHQWNVEHADYEVTYIGDDSLPAKWYGSWENIPSSVKGRILSVTKKD